MLKGLKITRYWKDTWKDRTRERKGASSQSYASNSNISFSRHLTCLSLCFLPQSPTPFLGFFLYQSPWCCQPTIPNSPLAQDKSHTDVGKAGIGKANGAVILSQRGVAVLPRDKKQKKERGPRKKAPNNPNQNPEGKRMSEISIKENSREEKNKNNPEKRKTEMCGEAEKFLKGSGK